MSAKRKRKLRDREARLRDLRQRHISAQFLSGPEISINREVEYIRRCATDRDARCVTLGALVFFSTGSGDAWMLDPADGFALCLALDGVAQPVKIVDTDSTTAVEWDRDFFIEENRFCTIERKTGCVTTFVDYPTHAILAAMRQGLEAQELCRGEEDAKPDTDPA
jgi:hypothetical protein